MANLKGSSSAAAECDWASSSTGPSLISTKTLTKVLDLHPRHLDAEIHHTIRTTLLNEYTKYSSEENGVIVEVLSQNGVRIIDNLINKESQSICFKIQFEAVLLKPYKGLQVTFVPVMIMPKGLVGKLYHDAIILFVPVDQMPKWSYNDQTHEFVHNEDPQCRPINRTTEVITEVIDFKFDLTKYNCIARLLC